MKKLYNTLRDVLTEQAGFNIAPYGENTFQTEDRTLRIELGSQNQLSASFAMYSASFTVTFLNGHDWSADAAKLSDSLMSFIPMEDRPDDESRVLPDNSDVMELLDIPQFSEIETIVNEETGTIEYSTEITINYQ